MVKLPPLRSDPRRRRDRARSRTAASKLERRFLLIWRSLGGPELEAEFRFDQTRRWRADFAHLPSRTLIEIEGGIYIKGGGRHNRGVGFAKDCEKHLAAWLAGWTVVRLTPGQITVETVGWVIWRLGRGDVADRCHAS